MPANSARIFIVDDHPLVRDGLALLLGTERDLVICGSAPSARETLKQLEQARPDLIILDLTLQDGLAFDLIKTIRERRPQICILVVSAFEERLYAERSLRCGAMGYVNKRECDKTLLQAIRTVLSGQRYVSEDIMLRLVNQAIDGVQSGSDDVVSQLTVRELQIFRLIGQGVTTGEIAGQLHISPHTVDSHREKIRHKLGVKNGHELRQHAMRWVIDHES